VLGGWGGVGPEVVLIVVDNLSDVNPFMMTEKGEMDGSCVFAMRWALLRIMKRVIACKYRVLVWSKESKPVKSLGNAWPDV
jgi:hypothetical protein